jgi:ADP-ribosylglycohydrolase
MAVGDALGAPLEGLSAQQIKSHYGRVRNYVDGVRAWKRKPYRWRLRGLYSDDTQQALALSEVLLRYHRVEPKRLAELYLALARPKGAFVGAHRGLGRTFRQVLASLERGVPAHLCGQPSPGIGAAMRIAPVPLYFGEELDGMFEAVLAASLMTHRDIRSLSGALAVAHAIRRLAAGGTCEPCLMLWVASDLARDEQRIQADYADRVLGLDRHARSLSRAVAHAESVVDLPRERALLALVEEANRHGAQPACKRPTQGFPPACIPTCLYLLITTDSFEEALIEVINLGGDTDTAGAILGAMAGAHYGPGAIPARWLDGLQNRQGIEVWAEALAQRSALGLPDLVATEHELTRREEAILEEFMSFARGGGDHGANHVL